jgi:hypothetical protein
MLLLAALGVAAVFRDAIAATLFPPAPAADSTERPR